MTLRYFLTYMTRIELTRTFQGRGMAGMRRLKHPWIWGISIGSALISIIIFVSGVQIIFSAPDQIKDQHIWTALKDIGPAIAGSWVLCAALLAITAAGITSIMATMDSESQTTDRKGAIAKVCIGEILSFWDRCNELELHAKLTAHISWIKGGLSKDEKKSDYNAFRRYFGDDWFCFFRVDPEALGELDSDTSARYISLSARVRNLTSRLNYLNGCDFSSHEMQFWVNYHNDTLEVLNGLFEPSIDMLRRLGDKTSEPQTFVF